MPEGCPPASLLLEIIWLALFPVLSLLSLWISYNFHTYHLCYFLYLTFPPLKQSPVSQAGLELIVLLGMTDFLSSCLYLQSSGTKMCVTLLGGVKHLKVGPMDLILLVFSLPLGISTTLLCLLPLSLLHTHPTFKLTFSLAFLFSKFQ